MAKLMLEVPQEIVDAVRFPPAEVQGELLKELALALYRRGALSLGKARALAQMCPCRGTPVFGDEPQNSGRPRGGGRLLRARS